MSEPAISELYLRIETLEKELQASQRYVVRFQEAQALLERKDKEIASVLNEQVLLEKQFKQLQQIVANQKTTIEQQADTIKNANNELNIITKEKKNLQDSLNLAIQQRDIAVERNRVIHTMETTIQRLQHQLNLFKNVGTKMINYFNNCNKYNTEFSEELGKIINL